jgi:hypothetical protein
MEHEEIVFVFFWPFINAQELLEVTTKLSVKLNDPVIDVGHNSTSQLSKVLSTHIQTFLSRIRLNSVSSSVLNMMKFSLGD